MVRIETRETINVVKLKETHDNLIGSPDFCFYTLIGRELHEQLSVKKQRRTNIIKNKVREKVPTDVSVVGIFYL